MPGTFEDKKKTKEIITETGKNWKTKLMSFI